MKLILYFNGQCNAMDKLEKMITNQIPAIKGKSIQTRLNLIQEFTRPYHQIDIFIIFVTDLEEITNLVSEKQLFDSTKIILILPSRYNKIAELGIQLMPSYICYDDSDFTDIIAVLKKIYLKGKLT